MNCREVFRFKRFDVCQDGVAMKITTDTLLCGLLAPVEHTRRILDIGTGTGAIALLAAQRAPDARVDALEPDLPSFRQAQRNFRQSPFARRLNVFPVSLQAFRPAENYDLIVSNPPFFEALPGAERSSSRHSDALPLEVLMNFAAKNLSENGKLSLIYPERRHYDVLSTAYASGLFPLQKIKMRDRKDTPVKRIFWTFTPHFQREFSEEEIVLFNEPGEETDFFKNLTAPFLLK